MATELVQPATLPILSHWIDGRPVEVLPERTGPIYNPATGQVIARVPRGGSDEVARAVAAAHAAFPAWRDTPLIARSQVFFAFRELMYQHREALAGAHEEIKAVKDRPGGFFVAEIEVGDLNDGIDWRQKLPCHGEW